MRVWDGWIKKFYAFFVKQRIVRGCIEKNLNDEDSTPAGIHCSQSVKRRSQSTGPAFHPSRLLPDNVRW